MVDLCLFPHPVRVLAVGPTWPGGGRSLSVPPSCESISIRAYLAGGGSSLSVPPSCESISSRAYLAGVGGG